MTDYDHSDPMGHRTPTPEALVRYCPGCGSIGPVQAKFRDCCPDGSDARMVPAKFAEKCRDTFQIAIRNICTPSAPADSSASKEAAGDTVSREDFDRMSGQLTAAKNLLMRLYNKHPETRARIEAGTGSWFAWGHDRDASPAPAATEPPATQAASDDRLARIQKLLDGWYVKESYYLTEIAKVLASPHSPTPSSAVGASEPVISVSALSRMVEDLSGLDRNQEGYSYKAGWNDAIRRALDYATPAASEPRAPVLTAEHLLQALVDSRLIFDAGCSEYHIGVIEGVDVTSYIREAIALLAASPQEPKASALTDDQIRDVAHRLPQQPWGIGSRYSDALAFAHALDAARDAQSKEQP